MSTPNVDIRNVEVVGGITVRVDGHVRHFGALSEEPTHVKLFRESQARILGPLVGERRWGWQPISLSAIISNYRCQIT